MTHLSVGRNRRPNNEATGLASRPFVMHVRIRVIGIAFPMRFMMMRMRDANSMRIMVVVLVDESNPFATRLRRGFSSGRREDCAARCAQARFFSHHAGGHTAHVGDFR